MRRRLRIVSTVRHSLKQENGESEERDNGGNLVANCGAKELNLKAVFGTMITV